MSKCNCHNDIIRDGTGQLTRLLKALDPSYAKVDERSLADLLNFAKGYADLVRFYDIPQSRLYADNKPVSWLEFFRRDMAVIAASISTLDLAGIKGRYFSMRKAVENYPSAHSYSRVFCEWGV